MWRSLRETHGDEPFSADMRHINRRDDVRKNVRLRGSPILWQVGPDSTNSADPPFGAFQRKRFSFAGRLGRAEPAAKVVVTDPAGNRQRRKESELSGKITHQEMELLDAALMERDFASECNRGETDSEAEE